MKFTFLFSLLSLLAAPAAAQDEPDCTNPPGQMWENICARIEFEKADAELNRIWPGIKADNEALDEELFLEHKGAVDALLASQRVWLVYRDAECARQGFAERGGSMESMLVNACLAAMTTARIKALTEEDGQ